MFWWKPSDGQPQQQELSLDTSVPTNLQDTLLPPSVLQPPYSSPQPTAMPQQLQQEQTQLPPEAIHRHDRTTHTTQTNIDNRQINIHVESPTYQQYQHYGPQATYGPTPPTARSRRRSRTPSRQPGTPTAVADGASSSSRIQPALQAEQRPALTNTPQPQATDTSTHPINITDTIQPQAMEHSDALPVLPMKRPAPTLTTRWFANVYGEAEPSSTGWDGSEDYEMPFKSQVFFNAYLGSSNRKVEMDGIDDPHREDHSSSDEEPRDLQQQNHVEAGGQTVRQRDPMERGGCPSNHDEGQVRPKCCE